MPPHAMITGQTNSAINGNVFDIQGLSVHDGPGCRTLIFLAGCNLNCFWCSNPEGIALKPGVLYFASKCMLCNKCIDNCSEGAISVQNQGIKIQRAKCFACNTWSCIKECYTDALKPSNYEISKDKLFKIIQRDRRFWGDKGGVTLTGGEPLLQIDFATEVLKRCYESYIHTAIETCGNIPWINFEKVLPYLDWIFFDLKHFDNNLHKEATGVGNALIIENAQRIAKEFPGRLIFRLPLIPGFNDSDENIGSFIRFLKVVGRDEINILPLHHLGREKYVMLDKKYLGDKNETPNIEEMKQIRRKFASGGIQCFLGSDTPF